ncbi:hypothetical protein L596_020463 [Steinernema carpocapsae]|uniref:Uncharacterized protein n=1 Tax=Steinernema carpocapsae TaxID=34508 RepID=A0A4U5MUD2_STECR|nr:hypothetical protein L596_020463 [Steinernema carpocapsae]
MGPRQPMSPFTRDSESLLSQQPQPHVQAHSSLLTLTYGPPKQGIEKKLRRPKNDGEIRIEKLTLIICYLTWKNMKVTAIEVSVLYPFAIAHFQPYMRKQSVTDEFEDRKKAIRSALSTNFEKLDETAVVTKQEPAKWWPGARLEEFEQLTQEAFEKGILDCLVEDKEILAKVVKGEWGPRDLNGKRLPQTKKEQMDEENKLKEAKKRLSKNQGDSKNKKPKPLSMDGNVQYVALPEQVQFTYRGRPPTTEELLHSSQRHLPVEGFFFDPRKQHIPTQSVPYAPICAGNKMPTQMPHFLTQDQFQQSYTDPYQHFYQQPASQFQPCRVAQPVHPSRAMQDQGFLAQPQPFSYHEPAPATPAQMYSPTIMEADPKHLSTKDQPREEPKKQSMLEIDSPMVDYAIQNLYERSEASADQDKAKHEPLEEPKEESMPEIDTLLVDYALRNLSEGSDASTDQVKSKEQPREEPKEESMPEFDCKPHLEQKSAYDPTARCYRIRKNVRSRSKKASSQAGPSGISQYGSPSVTTKSKVEENKDIDFRSIIGDLSDSEDETEGSKDMMNEDKGKDEFEDSEESDDEDQRELMKLLNL